MTTHTGTNSLIRLKRGEYFELTDLVKLGALHEVRTLGERGVIATFRRLRLIVSSRSEALNKTNKGLWRKIGDKGLSAQYKNIGLSGKKAKDRGHRLVMSFVNSLTDSELNQILNGPGPVVTPTGERMLEHHLYEEIEEQFAVEQLEEQLADIKDIKDFKTELTVEEMEENIGVEEIEEHYEDEELEDHQGQEIEEEQEYEEMLDGSLVEEEIHIELQHSNDQEYHDGESNASKFFSHFSGDGTEVEEKVQTRRIKREPSVTMHASCKRLILKGLPCPCIEFFQIAKKARIAS